MLAFIYSGSYAGIRQDAGVFSVSAHEAQGKTISPWYRADGRMAIGCAKSCRSPAVAGSNSMGGLLPRSHAEPKLKGTRTVEPENPYLDSPWPWALTPMLPSTAPGTGGASSWSPSPCMPVERLKAPDATDEIWHNLSRSCECAKYKLWQGSIYVIMSFPAAVAAERCMS